MLERVEGLEVVVVEESSTDDRAEELVVEVDDATAVLLRIGVIVGEGIDMEAL
jgi:hypothetical protein